MRSTVWLQYSNSNSSHAANSFYGAHCSPIIGLGTNRVVHDGQVHCWLERRGIQLGVSSAMRLISSACIFEMTVNLCFRISPFKWCKLSSKPKD